MEQSQKKYTPTIQNYDIKGVLVSNYNTDKEMQALGHKISIAPMMDITNVHFRFFMRLLTKHATLYTEMIHENAILHSSHGYKELLKFNPVEHPVVLQIGGNCPESLTKCARIAEDLGYDELNINIGCPSPKVQQGAFGACLMKEPEVVGECVAAMMKEVKIPVHIKTRLGVDDFDTYEFVHEFIKKTHDISGCTHYIMHARKAFLKGLNPAQNRNVPPLMYDRVVQLKKDFPKLEFSINGGFKTIEQIQDILKEENGLKGCMLGRVAYENPWVLADVDRVFYGRKNLNYSRREILEAWAEYGQHVFEENPKTAVPNLVKPIINLFMGEKHSAKYRHYLSDPSHFKKHDSCFRDLIYGAIETFGSLNEEAIDKRPTPENDVQQEKEEQKSN